MNATKTRNGLYKMTYPVTDEVEVTYIIERNEGEHPYRNIGRWIVTSEIGRDIETFDDDFGTMREAIAAVEEVQEAGYYQHLGSLGWCYFFSN